MKKFFNSLVSVVLCCLLVVVAATFVTTHFGKKTETGGTDIMGYQTLLVTSNSMEKSSATDVSKYNIKSFPKNAVLLIQDVPEDAAEAERWYAKLKVGDVLTFRYVYNQPVTITHRITSITKKETGGYIIELEGDNKNSNVNQLKQTIDTSDRSSGNYIVGKVKFVSVLAGKLINIVRSPKKLAYLVLVPFAVAVVMMLFKLGKGGDDHHDDHHHGGPRTKRRTYEMDDFQRSVAENELGNGRW